MQATTLQANEDVTGLYPAGPKYGTLIHITDDEAGKVVIRRSVNPRHLGCLTAKESAAVFATACGYAGYDALHDPWVEYAECDVVQEEQRISPLHQNVVDAVVDEVVANGSVPTRVDGNAQLRTDAVSARHEHRTRYIRRSPKHSAEPPELAAGSRGTSRQDVRLDALFRILGRVDVDTRAAVVELLAHATTSFSKLVSR